MSSFKRFFSKKSKKPIKYSVGIDPNKVLEEEYMDSIVWEIIRNQSCDYEFDWFGMDRLGQIAVFSSFNRAFTPYCVTISKELYLELEVILETLENKTEAIKVTNENSKLGDWEQYSKKGLFAYDYYDVHRAKRLEQYDLLFKPQQPIKVNDLDLMKYSSIIPKFDLAFGTDLSFGLMKERLIFNE